MEEKNKKQTSTILSSSLIIASITAYAYALLYSFETGYFSYFKVPISFIEVNINSFFKSVVYLVLGLFIIWSFIEVINKSNVLKKTLSRNIFFSFLLALYAIFIIYLYDWFKWPEIILGLMPPIIVYFNEFVLPLITGKGIKGYKEKIEHQIEIDREDEFVLDRLIKKYGISLTMLVYFAILFCIPIYQIGTYAAKRKTSFLVLKTTPELLVIRENANRFVCCEFDKSKKEIIGKYYIKTLDKISEEGIMILNEDIGPLKAPVKQAIKKQPIKIKKEESKKIPDKKAISQ